VQLIRPSIELLSAKKTAQEAFLRSVLRNEGICWSEFYKCVKRRKGTREIIPAINDHNGTIITDTIEKANILNSYYASFYCREYNIRDIELANAGET